MIKHRLRVGRNCPVIYADRCNSRGCRTYWNEYGINFITSVHSKRHSPDLRIFGNVSCSVITIQYSQILLSKVYALLFVVYIAQDFLFKSKRNKVTLQNFKNCHCLGVCSYTWPVVTYLICPPVQGLHDTGFQSYLIHGVVYRNLLQQYLQNNA